MSQPKPGPDVRALSDLAAHGREIARQVGETGRPVILTDQGREVAVMMSLETYDQLQDNLELREALAEGERDIAAGDLVPHSEVVAKLKRWAGGSG